MKNYFTICIKTTKWVPQKKIKYIIIRQGKYLSLEEKMYDFSMYRYHKQNIVSRLIVFLKSDSGCRCQQSTSAFVLFKFIEIFLLNLFRLLINIWVAIILINWTRKSFHFVKFLQEYLGLADKLQSCRKTTQWGCTRNMHKSSGLAGPTWCKLSLF